MTSPIKKELCVSACGLCDKIADAPRLSVYDHYLDEVVKICSERCFQKYLTMFLRRYLDAKPIKNDIKVMDITNE